MSYKLKTINPTKEIFSYRLDEYDCFELRTGICSLYLSENEANSIHKKEKISGESDVLYCRNLAKDLYQSKYFENINFQDVTFSIRMHHQNCGHFDFTDGQHRVCIAKHLNVKALFANIEPQGNAYFSSCSACMCKQKIEKENKKFKNKILKLLRFSKNPELPNDILDVDYMNFNEGFYFSNFINELNMLR
ncbi:TPA: hypothetical protein QCW96_004523 [Bacillus pacificus]|uniref:hypothetical protein n=1 Tax=Bacillus cereus group TaxID=86661 RepID=UPI0038457627|nr:hypothetical protein [Bacillus pacificus]